MAETLNYAGAGRCYQDVNTPENCAEYGRSYTFAEAIAGQTTSSPTDNPSTVVGLCPAGSHLPSAAEWNVLLSFVGSGSSAKLRAQGLLVNGVAGTDTFGFNWMLQGSYVGHWQLSYGLWSSSYDGVTYSYSEDAVWGSNEVTCDTRYDLWHIYPDAAEIRCVLN